MEKKRNLIEDIFYGNLDPSKHGPAVESEYRRRYDDVFKLIAAIEPKAGKETCRNLEDAVLALEEVISRDSFILGFQWGGMLQLGILGDMPDMFGHQE